MIGSIFSLAGGVTSGAGNVQQNEKNKGIAKGLHAQAERWKGYGEPLLASLGQGWSPGGALRNAEIGQAQKAVSDAYNKATGLYRSGAWRYGGSASPITAQRWREAQLERDINRAQAGMGAEMGADDILTSLGMQDWNNRLQWNAPQIGGQNTLQQVGGGLQGLGSAFGSFSGGGSF